MLDTSFRNKTMINSHVYNVLSTLVCNSLPSSTTVLQPSGVSAFLLYRLESSSVISKSNNKQVCLQLPHPLCNLALPCVRSFESIPAHLVIHKGLLHAFLVAHNHGTVLKDALVKWLSCHNDDPSSVTVGFEAQSSFTFSRGEDSRMERLNW